MMVRIINSVQIKNRKTGETKTAYISECGSKVVDSCGNEYDFVDWQVVESVPLAAWLMLLFCASIVFALHFMQWS